jgi:hypothetical protein
VKRPAHVKFVISRGPSTGNLVESHAMGAPRKGLEGVVVPAASLSREQAGRLFVLYSAHYDAADPARFAADLAEKDYVILLREQGGGELRGFSTQKSLEARVDGRRVRALFSGDTLIDPAFWGEQELVKAWCRFAGRLWAEEPEAPLYWLLISKGHRTYMYLPLFFAQHWPRPEAGTPAFEAKVMDVLASEKFGDAWKPEKGLLQFPESLGHLKSGLAAVPPGRTDDDRVNFFLSKNPGYAKGDELVCLAPISPENMRGAARRALEAGVKDGPLRVTAC